MTSRDPRRWMWAEALDLLEQAGRLHRQFFHPGRSQAGCPTWEPPVDIFETEHELSILVALPGVASEQIEILIEGGSLLVLGERPMPGPPAGGATIHRIEIPYGRFERRIELPAGLFEIRQRTLLNGCLLLTLVKLAQP